MKILFKIKLGNKFFFIKASNTYYYTSIENTLKETETIFEFNISKTRIHKILTGVTTLLGIGGAASMFLQ